MALWRALIGMFLRGAAGAGYQQTMAQRLLAEIPVAHAMTADPIAVPPDLLISRFVDEFIFRFHHREFPVTRDGLLIGCVGTKQVAAADRRRWPHTPIAAMVVPCGRADTIAPEAQVLDALAQMSAVGKSRLFVVQNGRLVGILSHRDLIRLLWVRLELIEKTRRPATQQLADLIQQGEDPRPDLGPVHYPRWQSRDRGR
jgi:CBS-domain-containing membrane protein